MSAISTDKTFALHFYFHCLFSQSDADDCMHAINYTLNTFSDINPEEIALIASGEDSFTSAERFLRILRVSSVLQRLYLYGLPRGPS